MKRLVTLFFLIGIIFTQGCDNKSPPKSKIENPLAGHAKALEKAKDLERQLHDAAEKQRKAIDSMSQ